MMLDQIFAIAIAASLAMAAGPALAQFTSNEEAIRTVLGDAEPDPGWFTPAFVAQVPPEQIRRITLETRQTIGPVTAIEEKGDGYLVHTATHDLPVVIVLDTSGAISGLLFKPIVARATSLDSALEAVTALPGRVAYLVTRDGETLAAQDENAPLAVGSAFKLAILKGLRDRIESGAARWDDVVELRADQISAPSGTLHLLPPGSPLTLHTLAALMIAISDNTATDALLDYVGRAQVAGLLGTKTVLKTRELFILKSDETLRARFLAAAAPDDYAPVFEEIARRTMPPASKIGGQHIEGFEYYVPLTRLCALMEDMVGEPILGLNPGLAEKEDWREIAYKGGSEQGVLNLTSRLVDKAGTAWCVAMSWNDGVALDENKGFAAYSGLLGVVRKRVLEEAR